MRDAFKDREMQLIGMKMKDIELRCHAAQLGKHQQMVGNGIAHAGVLAERLRATRHESSGGDRLTASEERHIVTLRYQFLSEVRNDSSSSAMEPRRDVFD